MVRSNVKVNFIKSSINNLNLGLFFNNELLDDIELACAFKNEKNVILNC